MCVPDLYFTQEGVQDDHATCGLVDEEITRRRMVRKTAERVWVSFGRDDRELGKDGQTRSQRSPALDQYMLTQVSSRVY